MEQWHLGSDASPKSPTVTPNVDLKTRPLNRDYNRGPNIMALKRRGFINHGSTLGSREEVC